MTDPIIIDKAIEAIVVLNATITNLRLYPSASPMITNSVDRAYTFLQAIFEEEDSVVFAESEKSFLISGLTLNEKDQKRPQVDAFLQLMLKFGIKSIAFEKGLDRDELLTFLKVVSQKPEDVRKEGSLAKVITGKNLRHVLVDQKLYVAVDKDQRVVSAEEIRDKEKYEDIIKYLMGESGSAIDLEGFKDAVKDPELVSRVFKTCMAQFSQQEGTTTGKKLPETVIRMISSVGEIVDPDNKEEISMQIASSIADMDDETLSMVLAQDLQGVLGEDLLDNVVDRLDDEKFERVAAKMRESEKGISFPEDRRRAYGLEYFLKGGIERRKRKDPRKTRLLHLKQGLNSILKGEDKAFLDRQVMLPLPGTVDNLFSKGKKKIAEGIIDRLGQGLFNENQEMRAAVSTVLAQISFNFASKQRMDEMISLSRKLINWIKFETTVHPNYKHVCTQLKNVAQVLIRNHQLAECNQLLETFHLIHSGKIKKNEAIQALAGNVLKSTATDHVLNVLLQEFQTDEKNLRKQAGNILAMLGSKSVGPLMDVLQKSQDISERDRILQLVSEIDPSMSPIDKEAIDSERIGSAGDDLTQQLKLVDQHVEQNDTKSAVKILFALIVKYAKEKEFSKAEVLRERLLEVDPMALTEIVKAGEVIEEEKSESIDQKHLDLWANLYETLSNEEANTLYYAMKSGTCNAEQTIISQGELNSKLYFVNEGQLKMVFHKEGEEFLIGGLNPGHIVGADSFFFISICTTSVIALSHVKFSFLEKEILKKWEDESPAFLSKLKDYSLGFDKIYDLLKEKGLDRRSHERVRISVKMSITRMDDSGLPIEEPVTGTLADISVGGLSFYIKTPKEKAVNMLLGPKLNMRFILPAGESQYQIDQNGTVVGVREHIYDYSVNVKFDKILDEKIIKEIKVPENSDEETLEI